MDIVSLIIQLVSGAVGGNLAGQALKDQPDYPGVSSDPP
jgi:hypothetical protein